MNSGHLFKYSRQYDILKKITSLYHSVYYEEICIINKDKIPVSDPVIFAPNHQNALMDALAIIYSVKKQPVFMARADIFKKETAKKILTFLKIVPVYRIRDGIEALSNNDETFELAFQVLKSGGSIGIMPEGNHGDQRRLRPLKKGIARLAIQAQELLDNNASIKIVPVGLEFSTYQGFRGNMVVNFGNAIDVKDFLPEYKTNSAKGLQAIRSKITDEMKNVMINIDSDVYYTTILEAKELYSYHNRESLNSFCDKFLLDKKLTDRLVDLSRNNPNELEILKTKISELNQSSKQQNLNPWIFSWKAPVNVIDWISDICRYLVFAPIFIFAVLFHIIPYAVSEFYSNKVKDKQFVSSMRFVNSFMLYLLWYLIILVVPFSFLFKAVILITMPVFGIISFDYWDSLKKAKVKFHYLLLKRQNSKAFKNAQLLHQELIQWLSGKLV